MKKKPLIILLYLFLFSASVNSHQALYNVKLKLTIGDKIIMANLIDSETTRDFIALLPLNLTLKEYANTEKISALPKRLTTKSESSGYKPKTGDITYYAPWGNIAIFHKDFGYSHGLIFLGKLESGIEQFESPKEMNVMIELIQN